MGYMNVVVGTRVISSAVIQSRIDGVGVFEGEEVTLLRSGPLILPLALIDIHTAS